MKKIFTNIVKIGVTVALFWWLSRSLDGKELLAYFKSMPIGLVFAVLGLTVLNVGGQALRYLYSVHLLMPPFTFKQGMVSHFAGLTFRLILPGSVGEVGRVFLLPGDNKTRLFTFFLDVFFSLGVMYFFFGISTYLLFPKMWYMLGFSVIFIVLFLVYRLLVGTTGLKRFVPDHVPYAKFGLANITFTLFTHMTYITQYWLLLRANGITWFEQAKSCYFILGVGSIPLSLAGMGFRENAAQLVLTSFGVSPEAAVGTALFVFFMNALVPALVGVILLNYASDIKLKDIRKTLQATMGNFKLFGRSRID